MITSSGFNSVVNFVLLPVTAELPFVRVMLPVRYCIHVVAALQLKVPLAKRLVMVVGLITWPTSKSTLSFWGKLAEAKAVKVAEVAVEVITGTAASVQVRVVLSYARM